MAPDSAPSLGLLDILKALPRREFEGLILRTGLTIDAAKRIEPAVQLARSLVSMPEIRDMRNLPPASVELLRRVAEAGGVLHASRLPTATEPLAARGILFVRGDKNHVELILPTAYLLLLPTWDGEDPRGLRALLAQASSDTLGAIASHFLGKPATPPLSLALETAWEALHREKGIEREIASLSPAEQRVLEGVERDGGEVDTEELLELEREPLRLRTSSGATQTRKGVGFALEKKALLIPIHPNRHVIPSEVARIVGAQRMMEQRAGRERAARVMLSGDHSPRRARFSMDPAPLALGLALAAREMPNEVRPGIGTPKSVIQKLATRFGREPAQVALIVALSRSGGLWEPSAALSSAPPGSLSGKELAYSFFQRWRRGGAWDEARPEAEVLRLSHDARDGSPVGVVREMVIEAIVELGKDRWIPWSALQAHIQSDARLAGVKRLFRRWAERVGLSKIDPIAVAKRIVEESLPTLGIVDIGEDDAFAEMAEAGEEPSHLALRLTPRGRAYFAARPGEQPEDTEASASEFVEQSLRVGPRSKVASILSLAPFADVGRASDGLDLVIAPQTISRALAAGFDPDLMKQRIEIVAKMPESLAKVLEDASVVVGKATYAEASGFLWVDDSNIRELLRSRKGTADMFVDPSPPGGLLLQPNVDVERLIRRCRTVGIEVFAEGRVVKARATSMSPSGKKKKGD